jgi:hypothetical protein
MARNTGTDFLSSLRPQEVRKTVAKALSDLPRGSELTGRAEKLARDAIKELRGAADMIEKRLNLGGSGTRSRAAKKAATTRKAAAAKRSAAAKRGAAKRKTTAKKSSAKKATKRRATKR